MADYQGLTSLLNTATGMTAVVTSRQDDSTNSLSGAAWLKFNGTTATNLFVSSNSWVGIGTNAEQLKICRRDGSMYTLYRQEGTLWYGYYEFLKIRFEGYSYYNSETDGHRLIWEAFFLSDGRIMLNIVRTPAGDDLGSSQLICGGSAVNIPIGYNSGGPYQYILTPSDPTTGRGWSIEAHIPEVPAPYDQGYLIQDGDGKTYTVENGAPVQIEGGLTAQNFRDHRVDSVDGRALIGLTSPKLAFWHDSDDPLPALTLKAVAVPIVPQLVVLNTIILDKAIQYVTIIADSDSAWNVSFDGGSIWYKYNNGWQQVMTDGDGCPKSQFERLSESAWASKVNGSLKFRVWLTKDGYIRNIIAEYKEAN